MLMLGFLTCFYRRFSRRDDALNSRLKQSWCDCGLESEDMSERRSSYIAYLRQTCVKESGEFAKSQLVRMQMSPPLLGDVKGPKTQIRQRQAPESALSDD